jgi:DNA-binding transcriptional MerR regulator
MTYTVQQLASLSGVTVRTLHHYDEIKLLSPRREANGYRIYGEPELMRLQQILFFRELEIPLEEIGSILAKPDFDMTSALLQHRAAIESKRLRLGNLLGTIDKTLAKISGEKTMSDDELFDAFWEKHETEYAAEAEQRWGNTEAYKQSKERTKNYTKEDFKRMAKEGEELTRQIAAAMPSGPASAETQALIQKHYDAIRNFYDPSPELYRGLGKMLAEDARFRAYYEKHDPALPEFMRDAMGVFCDRLADA